MRDHIVQYGQSIFDIAINLYGDISRVWDIIDDNALTLDSDLEGGQVLKIRTGSVFTANTITEYFNRYPAVVNNSDNDSTGLIGILQIVLKQIGNETNSNDGFILIDVLDGKPDYQFVWKNQDTNQPIVNSQNLTAVPAGTYSVTVVDADSNEKTLSHLTIAVADLTNYLVDDFGNYITDSNGNYIIVP